MKIAMLGHKTVPSRDGGVEVVVEELATRMVLLGHKLILFNRDDGASFPLSKNRSYKGIDIRTVRTLNIKGLAAFSSAFFATQAAIKEEPDVIHFHAEGPALMIPFAKKAGVKTVATIHGLDWKRAKWGGMASKIIKRGETNAALYADKIIVLSEAMQKYFRKEYGRETILLPNGVTNSQPEAPNIIKEKFELERDSYFLFLARIVPEKGLHYLIDAFKQVPTKKKLVIAGAPSDTDRYYAKVKTQASSDPRIIFTGFVAGRESAELFTNAYAYILPSDLEGMPMSLLEAMSYKKCCLTSDIPECASVIGNAGVVFKRGNIEDLANALNHLIENPSDVLRLGEMARKRVNSKYNWDRIVAQTIEVYKD